MICKKVRAHTFWPEINENVQRSYKGKMESLHKADT